MKKTTLSAIAGLALGFSASFTQAEGIEDPSRQGYYDTFKGKTVAFLPVSMGLDLTEGWAAVMRAEAESLGMEFIVRDAQFSTDLGAQALTSLVAEKPDVIVVHNPDVLSYARLLRKAEKAGIKVIQINMNSSYATDAYIGADWVGIGEQMAEMAVARCGEGTSGKIQIVQGVLTAAASAYTIKGIDNVLSKHPEIKIVSNQAANWDASTARDITATVLQQNPDLCGSIGFWDVMDTGTASALKEADRTDVHLITNGGGSQMACDNIKAGLFDAVISYDVPKQGNDLNVMIRALIQNESPAGANKVTLYSPMSTITADNMTANSCWSLDALK